ncbi:MAG: PadR family transcriptional regulator [Proteobacteria bacterium]|nr:PadR family transcriptional regulator [Pseudomonadota bacterium]
MDVRTICLGILSRGEATGYEIKKLFDEDGYQHFIEASFGSIYPALNRLTEEGLVSVREEAQEKRPDRKVYSITPAGRTAFLAALMKPIPEDRHRSPFVFAMLFSHLLPQDRVTRLIDAYIDQSEAKLSQIAEKRPELKSAGERFVVGMGQAIYEAMLKFIRAHRAEIEERAAEAAE